MCRERALIYFPEFALEIPFHELCRLISSIKAREIITYVYSENPFENIVMLEQELAQEIHWVVLIENPVGKPDVT